MSGRATPKEEDSALFRKSIGGVRPIKQDVVVLSSQRPKPRPLRSAAAERATPEAMAPEQPDADTPAAGEALLFKRAGLQNRSMQRLRRGQFPIAAELDLHGMTAAAAASHLSAFLTQCRHAGRRCVLVIHGKGRGSKDGRPVIKGMVNQWLRQREEVLAFCSARPGDGGSGAVYVLIKKGSA